VTIDTSAIQQFTDAELLTLYRNALAAIATGQSYGIGGRTLTRPDLAEVREQINWLEQRIQDDATGGNIALARFGDPQSV
jgi:hypothetical protein